MRRKDRLIEEREEIVAILERAPWGEIAFAADDKPYLTAMNYGIDPETSLRLWFHCAGEGHKLQMLDANPRVCFQAVSRAEIATAAEACGWTCRFESVTAFGRLRRAVDTHEKRRGLDAIMAHYGWKGEAHYPDAMIERTTVLCLEVESVTGKRSG